MRLNKVQQAAVKALEDIKATDIVPLDTRTLTSLYDAIIIATAESARQTKALARNVADEVKAAGGYVNSIEGEGSGEWVIVDCGELVVHIMLPQMRVLYHLEELWTPTPSVSSPRIRKSPEKKPAILAAGAKFSGAKGSRATSTSAKKPTTKTVATKTPATKRATVKAPAAKAASSKKPVAKKTGRKSAEHDARHGEKARRKETGREKAHRRKTGSNETCCKETRREETSGEEAQREVARRGARSRCRVRHAPEARRARSQSAALGGRRRRGLRETISA